MLSIDALARVAHDVVAEETGREDTCVLTTRVLLEACRYYGIPAAPLSVRVLVGNPAALDCLRDGLHPDEWPDGAHTVGFDERHPDALVRREGRWPGHLVVSVAAGADRPRLLVDATLGQFARPARGLLVPPVLVEPFPAPWGEDSPLVVEGEGWWAVYGPTYGPLSAAYRDGPDWRKDVRKVSARVIKGLGNTAVRA